MVEKNVQKWKIVEIFNKNQEINIESFKHFSKRFYKEEFKDKFNSDYWDGKIENQLDWVGSMLWLVG